MAANNNTNNDASVFTSDTTVTATAGNITLTAGNLALANTNTGGTVGIVSWNAIRHINNYGTDNIFLGRNAGSLTLTTGSAFKNVTVSSASSASLGALTTGAGNTNLGAFGFAGLTTGSFNTGLSYDSADTITTGQYNTVMGNTGGGSLTVADQSNILINTTSVAGTTHKLQLGRTGSGTGQNTVTVIAGIAGVTVASSAAVLLNTSATDSANQFGTVASSLRYKENVNDMDSQSEIILKMRPVTFNYKNDPEKSKHYGLIAEEVAELTKDLICYDETGQIETISYHLLPGLLLNEIKKQAQRIINLTKRINLLRA